MGSEIAVSTGPFGAWIGGYGAKCAFIKRCRSGTACTGIDDRMATAAVEIAPFVCHKCALDALFQAYALHCFPPVVFGNEGNWPPPISLKELV